MNSSSPAIMISDLSPSIIKPLSGPQSVEDVLDNIGSCLNLNDSGEVYSQDHVRTLLEHAAQLKSLVRGDVHDLVLDEKIWAVIVSELIHKISEQTATIIMDTLIPLATYLNSLAAPNIRQYRRTRGAVKQLSQQTRTSVTHSVDL